jgi:hypothetical protein
VRLVPEEHRSYAELEVMLGIRKSARIEGGANVLAAAQTAGVRRYLRQSIAFWAVPGRGLADEPIEIRVYDEAGNVIETHEQAGDFREP